MDSDRTPEEFFCGATSVPSDTLQKVLKQMGDKWKDLDTVKLAPTMYNDGFITYDEYYHLSNKLTSPGERVNKLVIGIVPRKGADQKVIIAFHDYLWNAGYEELAREFQQRVVLMCGVTTPMICGPAPEQTLESMVSGLRGKHVSEQMAKEFIAALGLDGSCPVSNETELSRICEEWMKVTSSCSPEALVQALIHTPGLGKFASGIACLCNPPEVQQWFYSLRDKWPEVASFLGYSKEDLEDVIPCGSKNCETEIKKFLTKFQMPYCGTRTIPILHKLADLSGVAEVRMKPIRKDPWDKRLTLEPAGALSPSSLKSAQAYTGPYMYPMHHVYGTPAAAIMPREAFFLVAAVPQQMMQYVGIPGAEPDVDPEMQLACQASYESLSRMHSSRSTGQAEPCSPASHTMERQPSMPDQPTSLQSDHGVNEASEVSTDAEGSSGARVEEAPVVVTPDTSGEHREQEASSLAATDESQPQTNEIPRDDNNDLIKVCGNPDAYNIVEALIATGASLCVRSEEYGSYPIHLAVLSGSRRMVELIITHAASSVNATRDDKQTPLTLACLMQDRACVELLVEHGANANMKDGKGRTCMHYHETVKCPDLLEFLVEKGHGELDIPTDNDYITPLTVACLIGGLAQQSAEYLIAKEANPNGHPQALITPLSAAAGCGSDDLVDILLRNGANIDGRNMMDRSTALVEACRQGQNETVMKLIENHADVNASDENGTTPVWVAVDRNSIELLGILMACEADVNKPKFMPRDAKANSGGYEITPLALAAARGHLDMVEALVEAKASVNYDSPLTLPAIAFAALAERVEIVEYFLKLNEVSKTLDGLKLALDNAISYGSHRSLKILLASLGGFEKVYLQALERGMERFAEELQEAHQEVSLTARQAVRSAELVLDDLVCSSVTLIEKLAGRQHLIDSARSKEDQVAMDFFINFFENQQIDRLFGTFLKGPSGIVFSDVHFTGEAFKQHLIELGKVDLVERAVIAVMQNREVQATNIEGEEALRILFGDNFMQQVEAAGLLHISMLSSPVTTGPDDSASPPLPPASGGSVTPPPQPTGSPDVLRQVVPSPRPKLGHLGPQSPCELHQPQATTDTQPTNQVVDPETGGYQEHRAMINGVPMTAPSSPVRSRFPPKPAHSPHPNRKQPTKKTSAAASKSPTTTRSASEGHAPSPPKSRRILPQPPSAQRNHAQKPATPAPVLPSSGHGVSGGVTGKASQSPMLHDRRTRPVLNREVHSEGPAATTPVHLHSQQEHVLSQGETNSHLPRSSSHEGMLFSESGDFARSGSLSTQESAGSSSDLRSYSRQDTGYSSGSGSFRRQPEEHCIPPQLQVPVNMEVKEDINFLKMLARQIPNWQLLATFLDFSEEEIHEIEESYAMPEEQCFQMLKRWCTRLQEAATCSMLYSQMRKMNREDLEKLILQHATTPLPQVKTKPSSVDLEMVVGDNRTPIEDLPDIIRDLMVRKRYTRATIQVVGHKD